MVKKGTLRDAKIFTSKEDGKFQKIIRHLYRSFLQKDLKDIKVSENDAYELIEFLKEEELSPSYMDSFLE